MGFFNRKHEQDDRHHAEAACQHRTLLPRWDSVEDMGKEDLATAFQCDACHESFDRQQATELRESAARILHEDLAR